MKLTASAESPREKGAPAPGSEPDEDAVPGTEPEQAHS
jgi:hypothetical protein